MITNTPVLTFEIDKQAVEPVLIQFIRNTITWTLRPQQGFVYLPKQIPGTPMGLPATTLGIRCSCGQLNVEALLDVLLWDEENTLFGGTILRGATTEIGGKPHEHLVDLSKQLKDSYDILIERKRSEVAAQ